MALTQISFLMRCSVGGAIGLGDYLEAGSIAFLFTLADWLESRSSDKVSSLALLMFNTTVSKLRYMYELLNRLRHN